MLNMAENTSLIIEDKPKNLQYIERLFNYDQKQTILEKTKKWITRTNRTRPHSISEWCKILGSTETNQHTRGFLENLVDEKALVLEKKDKNGVKLYRLDKKRLEKVAYNSDFWSYIRDFSFRMINKQEPRRTVTTEI